MLDETPSILPVCGPSCTILPCGAQRSISSSKRWGTLCSAVLEFAKCLLGQKLGITPAEAEVWTLPLVSAHLKRDGKAERSTQRLVCHWQGPTVVQQLETGLSITEASLQGHSTSPCRELRV